ncbi:MAG: hypothetical protein NTV06_02180 [candidate division Zixibacteria bacterium]|nr:hypothetical protein [candidate division Zixibacteria bacterium]
MKSEKIKRFLLLVLVIIALIIWLRNFNTFKGKEGFFQLRTASETAKTAVSHKIESVAYIQPRFNPFVCYEPSNSSDISKIRLQKPIKQEPPKISGNYTIDGIVLEAEHAQAILRQLSGEIVLVSIDSTLAGWKVEKIDRNKIVFSWGKFRDTLKILAK